MFTVTYVSVVPISSAIWFKLILDVGYGLERLLNEIRVKFLSGSTAIPTAGVAPPISPREDPPAPRNPERVENAIVNPSTTFPDRVVPSKIVRNVSETTNWYVTFSTALLLNALDLTPIVLIRRLIISGGVTYSALPLKVHVLLLNGENKLIVPYGCILLTI
jgi:hypothetical protein